MPDDNDRSRQPAKQRKAQAHAPQHRRREMMSAHLDEDLMLEYDRRSMAIRTGDQVEIMRGDFAGHEGEVLEIDYDDQYVEVDGAVNRSADGSQVARPIHPSNVRITELDLTDPRRRAKIERKGVSVEEPEPEPEPEEAEPSEDAGEDEEPEPAAEPAEGAKGPDVEPPEEPEPEPEPEEAEPSEDAGEDEEPEPSTGHPEDVAADEDTASATEPDADEGSPDPEADEAEDTTEEPTKEGSS
jgi:large subunit ribosomal protein L24